MEKNIPKAVVDAIKKFFKEDKDYNIYPLGKYKGKMAYAIGYEKEDNGGGGGCPSVFLYDGKNCKYTRTEAFTILDYFDSSKS